ncbi:MAG: ribose-5-phosphate isomerase RpiA [Rhodothermales bacterium]|nr:ribose-5-phosphate isomerase RpiA [Rhodothermales bacterium]
MTNADPAKLAAAKNAVARISDGMKIGMGTGSTASIAIRVLAERINAEGIKVVGAPSSFASERLARSLGIPTVPVSALGQLDLSFDGADEVSPSLDLIKGRGAAHTREKIIACSSSEFIVLVDDSKLVERLGEKSPVPVEVLPMAVEFVNEQLRKLGGRPELRMGKSKDGPVVSDQGMWIVDTHFDSIIDPAALDRSIKSIPGVLDHGLFIGMATAVLVGKSNGTVKVLTK